MRRVFLLQHCYEYVINTDVGETTVEEIKTLGIYSSKAKGEQAIEYYKQKEGFRDHLKECFFLEAYTLDENASWVDGFVAADEVGNV